MDLYQTPEPPHRTGTATPSIDNCDTISQSGDSTWLEGWVSKVTNLMSSRKGSPSVHFDKLPGADSSYGDSPKKGDGEARRPSVVQPVLKRLGLSSEVLAFIASLESDEEEQNQLQDEYQESPTAAQLRELEIYIPKISSLEPTEGSTKDSLLKAWETKAKVLQDALSRSKSTIQKEITGRKALENQVATITSRIALALEKMADEKAGAMKEMKNMHALLEKGFKEKAILQGQVVELSRAKREGYAASPRGAVDTSSLQAKVEQLTIDLEKSRLESSLLREECEVLRNAAKNDLSEKEKVCKAL